MTDRADDFTSFTGTLNGRTPSGGGSTWVVNAGGFNGFDNKCEWSSGDPAIATLESSVASASVSAKMGAPSGSTIAGFVARLTDANNCLLAVWNAYTPTWQIYKREGGTNTKIGADLGGSAYSVGDTIAFECEGSTLRLKVNGTQVGTDRSSTFNQTATKHGLWSSGVSMNWDDFSITEIVVASGGKFLRSSPLLISRLRRSALLG